MHRLDRIESANDHPRGHPLHADVAVCTCGWRSRPEEESNDSQIKDLRRALEAHQREEQAKELLEDKYAQTCLQIAARDVAEMEIEARRDAIEAGFDIRRNPHPTGTLSCLVYIDECQRNWKLKLNLVTEN